jgi:hypothetical protein
MVRLIVRFWPGAERFQREGRLDGLVQAVVFSLLLNVSFFSVFIWPDALSIIARTVVCLAVAGFWIVCRPWKSGASSAPARVGSQDDFPAAYLFQAAQREYLIGNWFQAEKLLRQLLQSTPHDIPARLRLAAVYRRVGRREDAARELEILSEMAGADKWHWEIGRARERLEGESNSHAA